MVCGQCFSVSPSKNNSSFWELNKNICISLSKWLLYRTVSKKEKKHFYDCTQVLLRGCTDNSWQFSCTNSRDLNVSLILTIQYSVKEISTRSSLHKHTELVEQVLETKPQKNTRLNFMKRKTLASVHPTRSTHIEE